jgi:hypothetical protein
MSYWTVRASKAYMVALNQTEAQLFRMLVGVFGPDRVVPHMSVTAVCGGEFPHAATVLPCFNRQGPDFGRSWARSTKCLFTIVDDDDDPRLVVEFYSPAADAIDAQEIEHQQYLKPVLQHVGIQYVTIAQDEFDDLLTPGSGLTLTALFFSKLGVADEGSPSEELAEDGMID